MPRLFSAFSALSYGSIGSKRGLQSKWVRALVFLVYFFFVCVYFLVDKGGEKMENIIDD